MSMVGRLLDWALARLPEPALVTCLDCRDGQHAACDGGCACSHLGHGPRPNARVEGVGESVVRYDRGPSGAQADEPAAVVRGCTGGVGADANASR